MISPNIPYDMYESSQELIIIIPLGGVEKETLQLTLVDTMLHISGIRKEPTLKAGCTLLHKQCYRGPITTQIALPDQIIYDQIHSSLSRENILTIILPRYSVPSQIAIHIEE